MIDLWAFEDCNEYFTTSLITLYLCMIPNALVPIFYIRTPRARRSGIRMYLQSSKAMCFWGEVILLSRGEFGQERNKLS